MTAHKIPHLLKLPCMVIVSEIYTLPDDDTGSSGLPCVDLSNAAHTMRRLFEPDDREKFIPFQLDQRYL